MRRPGSTSRRSIAASGMEFRSVDPGTPRGRRTVDVADPVDEHEHAPRAQIAQVDLSRASADAAAVGRIAEVARIVELAVEAAARAWQALKHVGDRVEAGLGDVPTGRSDCGASRSSGLRRMRVPVMTMLPLAVSCALTVVVAGACCVSTVGTVF